MDQKKKLSDNPLDKLEYSWLKDDVKAGLVNSALKQMEQKLGRKFAPVEQKKPDPKKDKATGMAIKRGLRGR